MNQQQQIESVGYARYEKDGVEVSTKGDAQYSALVARLADGRTIEEAYQLDVKGYRKQGSDWRLGKGRPPLNKDVNLWQEYLGLWKQWAQENPQKIEKLRRKVQNSKAKVLTDRFATSPVNQARALATILNEQPLGGALIATPEFTAKTRA